MLQEEQSQLSRLIRGEMAQALVAGGGGVPDAGGCRDWLPVLGIIAYFYTSSSLLILFEPRLHWFLARYDRICHTTALVTLLMDQVQQVALREVGLRLPPHGESFHPPPIPVVPLHGCGRAGHHTSIARTRTRTRLTREPRHQERTKRGRWQGQQAADVVAAVCAAGHVRAHARHLRLVREEFEISGGEISGGKIEISAALRRVISIDFISWRLIICR